MILLLLALTGPLWAAETPEGWLARAAQSAREGRFDDMRDDAYRALALDGDHQRRAQLLIGVSHELEGDVARALDYYDALARAYPRRQAPAVVILRQAAALGTLERRREARRVLRRLGPDSGLEPATLLHARVLRGGWDLEDGKDERGLQELKAALDSSVHSPWWRAQAHARLIRYAIEQCQRLPMRTDPDGLDQDLSTRATLLHLAQQQTAKLIVLGQPKLSQEALAELANAYAGTAEALHAIVGASERWHPRLEGIYLKALAHLERGIDVARTADDVDALVRFEEQRAALTARIDQLPRP